MPTPGCEEICAFATGVGLGLRPGSGILLIITGLGIATHPHKRPFVVQEGTLEKTRGRPRSGGLDLFFVFLKNLLFLKIYLFLIGG